MTLSPFHIITNGPVTAITILLILFLSTSSLAQDKRGLLYISTEHNQDYTLFLSSASPLTWYYNFSPHPSLVRDGHTEHDLEFVPMIHGADTTTTDVAAVSALRDSDSSISHVLVFNEPDGTTDSGGSNIDPRDAAEAYLNSIVSLREDHGLLLSVPATTGSPRGLEWLRDFNESCYDLNPAIGCEFDFVAAHWYGDFAAMASWLGTLHDLYPDLPIWLTEFALPQTDAEAALAMMNQSLPFLDDLEWVEKYAWFGMFRDSDANAWTGDGVSLLDDRGGLSQLGAMYLGGEQNGFEEGEIAEGGGGRVTGDLRLVLMTVVAVVGVLLVELV